MTYYPVFLNIREKRCVVCGGGRVALRKVQALLACGAVVEVISPDSCPELRALAESGEILLHARAYQPGDLGGARLVVAATDDRDVNMTIAREANQSGCPVNAVDDADSSDFIVPSVLRRGDITIAVSTGGQSPALARKLCARLGAELGAEYAGLASLVGEVRAEMKTKGLKVDEDTWQRALDLELLPGLIRDGRLQEARAALTRRLTKEVT
jgi:precorrin-2 dehydrogenase/sirohydrochlorin ferrochelatase